MNGLLSSPNYVACTKLRAESKAERTADPPVAAPSGTACILAGIMANSTCRLAVSDPATAQADGPGHWGNLLSHRVIAPWELGFD